MDAPPTTDSISVRQTLPARPDDPGVAFSLNPSWLDERNLEQLLSRPTLATCVYRAKDCLNLALERLLVMLPILVSATLLPFMATIICIYGVSKADTATTQNQQKAKTTEENERKLYFVFILVTCCYSLIFFTVAVDYSKVSGMVKDSKKNNRTGDNASTWSSVPPPAANALFPHKILRNSDAMLEQRQSSVLDIGAPSQKLARESRLSTAVIRNRNVDNSNSTPNSVPTEEPPDSNWWETYALLRMNLHCIIHMIHRSAGRLVENLISSQTSAVRRLRNLASREHHYLLQAILPNSVRILILSLLILSALVSLTIVKLVHPFGRSFKSPWIVDCILLNSTMTFLLLLHFLSLLLVACLISSAPSRIYVTGLLGRWLLTLTVCIFIQCAIMPRMVRLSECLVVGTANETGLFSIFTNIDSYSDTPIVISNENSKSTVLMLLNSLITAILASVLYQMNFLQTILSSIGTLFKSLLNLSPVEGLVLLLSLFGTQMNFLIIIMPFLGKLSESELFCIFVIKLVQTPCESDPFWEYKPPSDSGLKKSLTKDALLNYTPQRIVVRSLLSFPLIILFSRIIYPVTGKFGTRASVFRRLRSMNCGRPFGSVGESLIFFVTYSMRSICRFLVMIAFVHCLEFIFHFLISVVRSSESAENSLIYSSVQLRLLASPMSLLLDTVEVLPSITHSLSHYVAYRFIYPRITMQELFIDSRLKKRENTIDPFLLVLDSISSPAKEMVLTGSLTWHSLAMYIAFTVDCLHESRKTKAEFILRGCVAALLVYSAMYNLMYMTCDPRMLQHYDNIGLDWIKTMLVHAKNPSATNCTE